MFLQKVDNVFDLEWAPGVTYGEVRLREEIEQSKYAFNQDTGIPAEEFAAFHRDQFEANYGFADRLADAQAAAAGARVLPEVLAPVQPARLERQHRRHRAHRLHPAGAAAGRAAVPRVRGRGRGRAAGAPGPK